MEQILGGIDSEDQGNESVLRTLYYRVELAQKIEKDNSEMMWLAKGVISEVEKIKRFSTKEYLMLLKYTIDHSKK